MSDRTHNGNLSPLSRLNVILCYLWYNYEIRIFEFHLYQVSMNHLNFINNYFNVYLFTYLCLEFSLLLVWNVAFSTMALRTWLMHHTVDTAFLPYLFTAQKTIFLILSFKLPDMFMFIISKWIINWNVYHHKNTMTHTLVCTSTIATIGRKISHLITHILYVPQAVSFSGIFLNS